MIATPKRQQSARDRGFVARVHSTLHWALVTHSENVLHADDLTTTVKLKKMGGGETGKIRVLIADDHPLIRNGLRQVLTNESGVELVGEAANAGELFDSLDGANVDVLVLDLMMSAAGADILAEVRSKYPGIRILILSVHSEEKLAVPAMKGGANGYLSKESAGPEIVKTIRKVASGNKYVSAATAEILANSLETDSTNLSHLSAREFQVLCKIAEGKTVSQIATGMSLSVKTVATYRARLLEKTRMRNTTELVRYAIQNGLV